MQQGLDRPVGAVGPAGRDDAGDADGQRGAVRAGDMEHRARFDPQVGGGLGGDGGLDGGGRRGHRAGGAGQPSRTQPGVAGEVVLRGEHHARGEPVGPGQPGVGHRQGRRGAHSVRGLRAVGREGPADLAEDGGVLPAQGIGPQCRLAVLARDADAGLRRPQLHGGAPGPGLGDGPAQPGVLGPVHDARAHGGEERGDGHQDGEPGRGPGRHPQPGPHPGGDDRVPATVRAHVTRPLGDAGRPPGAGGGAGTAGP